MYIDGMWLSVTMRRIKEAEEGIPYYIAHTRFFTSCCT